MIYSIKGTLVLTDVNFIVVECGGIGYKCFSTLNTIKNIGKTGDTVTVYTYLAVKEDALDLYGFAEPEELDAFKLLIGVSGVGPKAAVSVLSELSPSRLALCIASGDSKSITKAQGIGKKTADRIVLELKDKMGGVTFAENSSYISAAAFAGDNSDCAEAVEALTALGFQKSDAAAVVGSMQQGLSVDEMIRQGLKQLAGNL